jgi:cytochrome c oxidase subunit 2
MLRTIPAYLALATLVVACGGNESDTAPVVEDQAEAAETVVADAEDAVAAVADEAVAAVDASKGEALFAPCIACHGVNGEGNMTLNAPGIAGQSESYLKRQLWEFKNGQRGNHEGDTAGAQMRPMAAALTDRQAIADVSAYIASLPPTVPPVTVEGDADNGEKLYISKCGACHGGDAWGNESLYTPRLTMLGDAYVVRQVTNFQEGMRGTGQETQYGKQMATMAKIVSAEELQDIVAFLNELAANQ